MLVAPPGSLKSSLLVRALKIHPTCIILSDLNTTTLQKMMDELTCSKITTIALSDAQKIYERDPSTARNLEGSIRALMEEGWSGATHMPKGINSFLAQSHVIFATTPAHDRSCSERWIESGFARRWLHMLYRLVPGNNSIQKAFENSRRIDFPGAIAMFPPLDRGKYPDITDRPTRMWLRSLTADQRGPDEAAILLSKIYSVLAAQRGGRPWAKKVILDCVPAIQKGGAFLEL